MNTAVLILFSAVVIGLLGLTVYAVIDFLRNNNETNTK
jgi:heme/copper-type cytochrome/quinol oxidase subunit 2